MQPPSYRLNAPAVVQEIIDGEAVVLHVDRGHYYSLQGSAAEIWDALLQGHSAPAVVLELQRRYGVSGSELEGAVEEFVARLLQEDLLVADAGAKPAPMPAASPASGSRFQRPVLEKFTDLEDLLLLDPVHEVDDRGWPAVREPGAA